MIKQYTFVLVYVYLRYKKVKKKNGLIFLSVQKRKDFWASYKNYYTPPMIFLCKFIYF